VGLVERGTQSMVPRRPRNVTPPGRIFLGSPGSLTPERQPHRGIGIPDYMFAGEESRAWDSGHGDEATPNSFRAAVLHRSSPRCAADELPSMTPGARRRLWKRRFCFRRCAYGDLPLRRSGGAGSLPEGKRPRLPGRWTTSIRIEESIAVQTRGIASLKERSISHVHPERDRPPPSRISGE